MVRKKESVNNVTSIPGNPSVNGINQHLHSRGKPLEKQSFQEHAAGTTMADTSIVIRQERVFKMPDGISLYAIMAMHTLLFVTYTVFDSHCSSQSEWVTTQKRFDQDSPNFIQATHLQPYTKWHLSCFPLAAKWKRILAISAKIMPDSCVQLKQLSYYLIENRHIYSFGWPHSVLTI